MQRALHSCRDRLFHRVGKRDTLERRHQAEVTVTLHVIERRGRESARKIGATLLLRHPPRHLCCLAFLLCSPLIGLGCNRARMRLLAEDQGDGREHDRECERTRKEIATLAHLLRRPRLFLRRAAFLQR